MAGYSGTPLPKKLGIKEGARVALLGAPPGFVAVLGDLPAGATIDATPDERPDITVLFTTARADLAGRFADLAGSTPPAGAVWIAWPKRSSGLPTDLTEDTLRAVCLPTGMVDNKVCAIDDTWSGLRFVWRRELRPDRV